MTKVTFCYRHIAPYHNACLTASCNAFEVTVVSYADVRDVLFSEEVISPSYRRITPETREGNWDGLKKALEDSKPEVVVIPGWGSTYNLVALLWAARRDIPVVVISDSNEVDCPRKRIQEAFKSTIISMYSSGLVAGKDSFKYLSSLGMPENRIFVGCDIVDNSHFEIGALGARNDAHKYRMKYALETEYFLASGRFISQKNFPAIISAFSKYMSINAADRWQLVILGDGPGRAGLQKIIQENCLGEWVLLPGVVRYSDLPIYYGLAGAFLHAPTSEPWGLVVNEAMAAGLPVLISRNCGCAGDLVQEGRNGFTFNPLDVDELSVHLSNMACGVYDRQAMGTASREIISSWSPDRFAVNIGKAIDIGLTNPRKRISLLKQSILWSIINFPYKLTYE